MASAMATSPPQSLGALIQMDMSGLESMLRSLVSTFDVKLESVTGQLTELQSTMATQQVQMEDVLSRLVGAVSQADLDEIRGIEPDLSKQRARRHSKELGELRDVTAKTPTTLASLASSLAKLEEKKVDRDQFERLVSRESVERMGHMEAAINQQRVVALEQRVEQMHLDAHSARVTLNQMRQAIAGPIGGKVQLGSALKSGPVSTPRIQLNGEAASHRASPTAPCPHLALSLRLDPRPQPRPEHQQHLAGGPWRDAPCVAALRQHAAASAPRGGRRQGAGRRCGVGAARL